MTLTIRQVPALFEPVIDEVLSLYGVVLQKQPLMVACESQEKFLCLQERLKEAQLSYSVADDATVTFCADYHSDAVRLLLQSLPAEIVQDDKNVRVTINDKRHQKEFAYLLHYVLANYTANAFIVMLAEQSVARQVVEVARPLDYYYCEPLRVLLLQVPHGRRQRAEAMIERLLGPAPSLQYQQPAQQQQQPKASQPAHIIEISAEHSLRASLPDFYLLRSQFAFSRAEIIDENQIELFFTEFAIKQAAARYLEACRRERDDAFSAGGKHGARKGQKARETPPDKDKDAGTSSGSDYPPDARREETV